MTERERLRNQFSAFAVFGALSAVKVFWTSFVGIRYYAAVMTGVFIWLAGTKYLEYREKYPRKPDAR
jgi:hypothetical protein